MIEKRDYFQLLLHFLLIVVLSLIQIIYPIFVSEILTVQSTVNSIFVIVCSLIVGKMIVNICDLILSGSMYWNFFKRLRMKLIHNLVYMDYEDVLKRSVGELTQTVENDSSQVIEFYLVFLMTLLKDILFLLGVVCIAFIKSWIIGVSLIVMLIFLFIVFRWINKVSEVKWAQTKQAYQNLFDMFSTCYLMMTELKKINRESYLEKKLNTFIQFAFKSDLISGFISYQLWISTIFSFGMIKFIVLLIGCTQNINLSFIYLFVYYIDLLDDPIYELRTQMENIPSAKKAQERVFALLKIKSKLHFGTKLLNGNICCIDLDHVHFGYNENLVLKDCSLHFENGNIYGLIGPSGSGKSTLINLISHLYEPQSGTIYINNVRLNEYKEKETLKEIEYIGQNEKNMNPYEIVDPYHRYSREKIEKDLGYTLNDELSKGQLQYLYLYKALRSEKSVIILDEIFSYVDMDKIKNAFSKFKEMKKIIIVVTHEKEVMQFCDSTISMEDL